MRLRAFAKINLGLDVLGTREDGYHEVRMIMQTIRMFDQLDVQRSKRKGIHIHSNLPWLPMNQNNLVYKAADLLMKEFEIEEGLNINLKKVIPVAAGMAGGSSDAAAMLVGVNRIFHLGLSREELMKRAASIGADVPYCVMRGTALAEGIGEKLSSLPPMPEGYVLIGKPKMSVSTKAVYTKLDEVKPDYHPDIDGLIKALEAQDFPGVACLLGNILETVTIPAHPVLDEIKKKMMHWGALNSLMSGSGPTVFGLFDDKEKAEYAARKIKKSPLIQQSFLTTFYNTDEWQSNDKGGAL